MFESFQVLGFFSPLDPTSSASLIQVPHICATLPSSLTKIVYLSNLEVNRAFWAKKCKLSGSASYILPKPSCLFLLTSFIKCETQSTQSHVRVNSWVDPKGCLLSTCWYASLHTWSKDRNCDYLIVQLCWSTPYRVRKPKWEKMDSDLYKAVKPLKLGIFSWNFNWAFRHVLA